MLRLVVPDRKRLDRRLLPQLSAALLFAPLLLLTLFALPLLAGLLPCLLTPTGLFLAPLALLLGLTALLLLIATARHFGYS